VPNTNPKEDIQNKDSLSYFKREGIELEKSVNKRI
jgi:hypothetical protein